MKSLLVLTLFIAKDKVITLKCISCICISHILSAKRVMHTVSGAAVHGEGNITSHSQLNAALMSPFRELSQKK